jgi:hypothetical protein
VTHSPKQVVIRRIADAISRTQGRPFDLIADIEQALRAQ